MSGFGKNNRNVNQTVEAIWRRRATALLLSLAMILSVNASSLTGFIEMVRAEAGETSSASTESDDPV